VAAMHHRRCMCSWLLLACTSGWLVPRSNYLGHQAPALPEFPIDLDMPPATTDASLDVRARSRASGEGPGQWVRLSCRDWFMVSHAENRRDAAVGRLPQCHVKVL
jgi:hypothetical protein